MIFNAICLFFGLRKGLFHVLDSNAFSPPPVLALCKGTIYGNASPRVESLPSCSRIVFASHILRLILLVYNDAFTSVCVAERGARNNQDLYLLCAPTKENIYIIEDNPIISLGLDSWVWICGIFVHICLRPPFLDHFHGMWLSTLCRLLRRMYNIKPIPCPPSHTVVLR